MKNHRTRGTPADQYPAAENTPSDQESFYVVGTSVSGNPRELP